MAKEIILRNNLARDAKLKEAVKVAMGLFSRNVLIQKYFKV